MACRYSDAIFRLLKKKKFKSILKESKQYTESGGDTRDKRYRFSNYIPSNQISYSQIVN